jgi:acetoin utilization protein AcuB
MKISDHMTREMVTVAPDTPLPSALELLQESKLRCLPVVQRGELLGLLLLGDADQSALHDSQHLKPQSQTRTVADVMRPPSIQVHPNHLIEQAAVMMLKFDVRGLPVVDDQNKLVGVITVSDLLDVLVAHPPITLWG